MYRIGLLLVVLPLAIVGALGLARSHSSAIREDERQELRQVYAGKTIPDAFCGAQFSCNSCRKGDGSLVTACQRCLSAQQVHWCEPSIDQDCIALDMPVICNTGYETCPKAVDHLPSCSVVMSKDCNWFGTCSPVKDSTCWCSECTP